MRTKKKQPKNIHEDIQQAIHTWILQTYPNATIQPDKNDITGNTINIRLEPKTQTIPIHLQTYPHHRTTPTTITINHLHQIDIQDPHFFNHLQKTLTITHSLNTIHTIGNKISISTDKYIGSRYRNHTKLNPNKLQQIAQQLQELYQQIKTTIPQDPNDPC